MKVFQKTYFIISPTHSSRHQPVWDDTQPRSTSDAKSPRIIYVPLQSRQGLHTSPTFLWQDFTSHYEPQPTAWEQFLGIAHRRIKKQNQKKISPRGNIFHMARLQRKITTIPPPPRRANTQGLLQMWHWLTTNITRKKKKRENPLQDKADLLIPVVQIPLYATDSALSCVQVQGQY